MVEKKVLKAIRKKEKECTDELHASEKEMFLFGTVISEKFEK